MVNVTKDNFIEQTNDLIKHLPTAAFIAIDEEMTGISLPGTPRSPKVVPPNDHYPVLKKVPERYSIVQLGVSLFHANTEEGSVHEWRSRRYNFYCFPGDSDRWSNTDTREVVLNPGSMAFLQKHGMSFDTWAKQGIPYQPNSVALETLRNYVDDTRNARRVAKEKQEKEPTVQDTVRRKVHLTKAEDVDFHARTMAALREWLDSSDPPEVPVPEGVATLLPPCNSFLRRALYETIEQQYPSLIVESAGNSQIRVLRLNAEEKATREERINRENWENVVTYKVGMWRVFEAISRICRGESLDISSVVFAPSVEAVQWDDDVVKLDATATVPSSGRCVPLVVHNGFMDICFLMTHFHSATLPETMPLCKRLIQSYFPVVYDTKVVTTECCTIWNNQNSTLGPLFKKVVTDELSESIELVSPSNAEASSKDQEHEAAYDAWMTGCVYIGLCKKIRQQLGSSPHADGLVGCLEHLSEGVEKSHMTRSDYGRNKLFQMSMFTLDLEQDSSDPLSRGMLPDTTFRVSGIDPSVATRDIIRCLHRLTDSQNRAVEFEIIWIDDTSFLVAATSRIIDESVMRDHGALICEALKQRFSSESVISLEQALEEASNPKLEVSGGFFSRIWSMFSTKRKAEGDGERSAKRIRRS